MNFTETLREKTEYAAAVMEAYLPCEEGQQRRLLEAMNYSMRSGGKRLRPVMMRETYLLGGGEERIIEPFMAAMEMIHNHSLVHDDLPALDGDRFRRGKETTWVRYGEAEGVLCGDALLNLAYETALKSFSMTDGSAGALGRTAQALAVLAEKAGYRGMMGGQSVDVMTAQTGPDKDALAFIYTLKTGALLEGSLMIGAILSGADQHHVDALEQAGRMIGRAFQIRDDVLDLTGSEEKLGKPIGSDEKNGKTTYVTLFSLEEAMRVTKELTESAVGILRSLYGEGTFLEELTVRLIDRDN